MVKAGYISRDGRTGDAMTEVRIKGSPVLNP